MWLREQDGELAVGSMSLAAVLVNSLASLGFTDQGLSEYGVPFEGLFCLTGFPTNCPALQPQRVQLIFHQGNQDISHECVMMT